MEPRLKCIRIILSALDVQS